MNPSRLSRQWIAGTFITTAVVLVMAAPAIASSLTWSQVYGTATVPGVPSGSISQSFDTGQLSGIDTINLETASASNVLGMTATSQAQIMNGELGVLVATGAGSFNSGNIQATSTALFFDTLTLSSSSLAAGTTVHLGFSLVPHYLFGSGCASVGYAALNASLTGPTGTFATYMDDTCNGPSGVWSGTITASIGQAFPLLAALSGTAVAGGFSVDAIHTLNFYLDPVENFTYSTASGNSYLTSTTTPVPEPGTLLLASAGALAWRWRRKNPPDSGRSHGLP